MTTTRNGRVGGYGERVAARHLVQAGMRLLEQNWRCELGEIDLVLEEGTGAEALLVVCEVKTRTGPVGGHPVAAVDEKKAKRLRLLGYRWLEEHDQVGRELRVDVVGVLRSVRGPAQVLHVRGVA